MRYGHLKIQDGRHRHTRQIKPIHSGPIVILMSRLLFRHLNHQNLSTGDDFIHSSGIIILVPLLATMEVVVPLGNDPIMSGRSIWSFRHLEHQNPSIISESIGRDRMAAKKREKK